MKYEGYEGSIEDLVLMKIKEIEQKENIRVLYAVEAGSRAWGFASPDSDYDIRFVYVRPKNEYLKLCDIKDFLDCELNDVLDINGWDVKKVLQHFHKSNATLFEWANSPIVYYSTSEWKDIYNAAEEYFACKPALYHYYGTANHTYNKYLLEDMVKYKKYLYALRPILACKWIEKKKCPPPVLFEQLCDEMSEDYIKHEIKALIDKKIRMTENDKAPAIAAINEYIENNLEYYKNLSSKMTDDRNRGWERLEKVFVDIIDIASTK